MKNSKTKTAKTTTFIEQIKKTRSLAGIERVIASGKFICSNPKTLRRWNRAITEKLHKLDIGGLQLRLSMSQVCPR